MKATMTTWNTNRGFGFCTAADNTEFFIHKSALHPVPTSSELGSLQGTNLVIIATQPSNKGKEKVTVAGWGRPIEGDYFVRIKDGRLYIKGCFGLGYDKCIHHTIPLPPIQGEERWLVHTYGRRLVVLVEKLDYHGETEEHYREWLSQQKKRRANHKKVSPVSREALRLEPPWTSVLVTDDDDRRADICHVTGTVYARKRTKTVIETQHHSAHYGGETWKTGGSYNAEADRTVAPEVAFDMPQELKDMATDFGGVAISAICLVSPSGYLTTHVALDAQKRVVAFWSKLKSCWRRPGNKFALDAQNLTRGNNQSKQALVGAGDHYRVFMAFKQGLKIDQIAPWGRLS